MDTASQWTTEFTTKPPDYQNYALYVLYLLFPIIASAAYFILEAVLVMHDLDDWRPISKHPPLPIIPACTYHLNGSSSHWCRAPICHWPGL